jgi:hypothetical protein
VVAAAWSAAATCTPSHDFPRAVLTPCAFSASAIFRMLRPPAAKDRILGRTSAAKRSAAALLASTPLALASAARGLPSTTPRGLAAAKARITGLACATSALRRFASTRAAFERLPRGSKRRRRPGRPGDRG